RVGWWTSHPTSSLTATEPPFLLTATEPYFLVRISVALRKVFLAVFGQTFLILTLQYLGMPYKERAKSGEPRKRAKPTYQVTNWTAYNQRLRKRGMITLYFPKEDLIAQFYNEHSYVEGVSGRVAQYSKAYAELMFLFYRLFGWAIRQVTGMMEDYWNQRHIDLPVPSFGHLCDPFAALDSSAKQHCNMLVARLKQGKNVSMIVDSTGMKTDGRGEWYEHKYNKASSRKGWAKLYLAIDPDLNCLAVEVTSEAVGDAPLDQFLAQGLPVDKVIADGAYYQIDRNQVLSDQGIEPVIPPPCNAVTHGTPGYEQHDKTVQYIQDKGTVYAWHKKQGHDVRTLVEAQFSHIKRGIGDRLLTKRTVSRKTRV
ncbi:IS5 family transposase, partial [Chromobacterium piscinae]